MKPKTTQKDSARMAAVMSGLVYPGAGQFYNGQKAKGLVFGCIEAVLLVIICGILVGAIMEHFMQLSSYGQPVSHPMAVFFSPFARYWWLLAVVYLANRVVSIWDAYHSGKKILIATPISKD